MFQLEQESSNVFPPSRLHVEREKRVAVTGITTDRFDAESFGEETFSRISDLRQHAL
jgi:hypothetical protein